ncbi:formate dehydrogenase accessory protein FdhE [Consotaella salsifontis]|uniref:Protein FdhE homolog n=1 Tax=Consotaella salsifontis TaxID=1365950 RepID=A0A1T4SMK4_9HYPH|nr:formate dehydrogenase accessory protein FdhE [Consotaella salsifontis]SKA29383.1 Tat proofreading chaperone FdhE [Consotaella salsifontis]
MPSFSSPQPDPSVLGGVAKAPFAIAPLPGRLFAERAARFVALAQGNPLGPYLRFLGDLSHLQDRIVAGTEAPAPLAEEQVARARAGEMPPLDSDSIKLAMLRLFEPFRDGAAALAMPAPASAALAEVSAASPEALGAMADAIMAAAVPPERLAQHLFVAAALEIGACRLAASLDGARLVPVGVGVCPACGGRPLASLVVGFQGAEGARYAVCSLCSTRWNEVRVKCLACGSTKGISYHAATAGETTDEAEATVKAEACSTCGSWLKILYQNKNPSLDVVADDVASLGLDMLMRETDYRRAGFAPFLLGY